MQKKTKYDIAITKLKNNRAVVVILIASIIFIGVGNILKSSKSIKELFPTTKTNSTPSPANDSSNTKVTLKGQVINEKGEGIQNVQITSVGKHFINVLSDSYGQFLFKHSSATSEIEISFIKEGYLPLTQIVSFEKIIETEHYLGKFIMNPINNKSTVPKKKNLKQETTNSIEVNGNNNAVLKDVKSKGDINIEFKK